MMIDDSEFDDERPNTPRWFQRLVRAGAWLVVIAGWFFFALLVGLMMLVLAAAFVSNWPQGAWSFLKTVGLIIAFLAAVLIWVCAKDYVQKP